MSGDGDRDQRKSFRVTGRVQGVGFRWWTRGVARDLGLRGTVRNCPDGSVEIHASGTEEAMSQFELQLQRGPSGARVAMVRAIAPGGVLPDRDFIIDL